MVRMEGRRRTGALLRALAVTPTDGDLALEPSHKLQVLVNGSGGNPARGRAPVTVSGTSFSSQELAFLLGHYMGLAVQ